MDFDYKRKVTNSTAYREAMEGKCFIAFDVQVQRPCHGNPGTLNDVGLWERSWKFNMFKIG
jgi:hypothetical protein